MKKNSKILLLEDDKVEAMKVKRALNEISCPANVEVCENGIDGIEWLNNEPDLPNIIILDLNMPKMNGIEFLKVVKNDERLKIIPIVVLTTSNRHSDILESYKNYIAGYMVKPIRHHKYLETMEVIKQYWETSKLVY